MDDEYYWFDFTGNPSTVDNTIITGTEGNDKICNTGSNVSINALEGDNIILNGNFTLSSDGLWRDWVAKHGEASKVTINSGSGSNSIRSSGSEVVINTGDGNNHIDDYSYGALIITGNGDDSIDSGLDYYIVDDPIITTINSGAGNDKISATHNPSFIDAGEGDDTIIATAQNNSAFYGGIGNDIIDLIGYYDVNLPGSYISIVSNESSSHISLSRDFDFGIINFTFENENANVSSDKYNEKWMRAYFYAVNVTVDGGEGNDTINNGWSKDMPINGGEGDDLIIDRKSKNSSINAGSGNDTIDVYQTSKDMLINGEEGDDSISVGFSGSDSSNTTLTAINDTIQAGEGNDTVEVFGVQALIDAGNGNDYIYSCGTSNATIRAGDGNDIISSVSRNQESFNTFIDAGNGNNHINVSGDYDYDEKYVYSNSNATVLGGNDSDTIGIFDAANVSINSGDGDDLIGASLSGYTNIGVATINAGAGSDTIYGYDRGDGNLFRIVYQYSSGDGNDFIYYFSDNDKLQIAGDFSTLENNRDIVIKVGDGTITLKDMAGKTMNVTNDNGVNIISLSGDNYGNGSQITNIFFGPYIDMRNSNVNVNVTNTTINNTTIINNINNTYIYDGGNKVINNYQQGEVVQLTSDYAGIDLNGNSFYVNSSSGKLEIQNSRDKFIGYSGSDNNVVAYSYLASGGGQIDGRGKNQAEIIIGADNADNQIYAGNGGSSLWGGNGGADTLTGGDGYDEFFYAMGSGNDVIQNAGDNDVINLLGVSLSQISGFNYDSSSVDLNFNDGGHLKVESTSSVGYRVENQTFFFNRSTNEWAKK